MEVIVRAIRQSGIAPKVKLPAAVLFGLGAVLTAVGLIDDTQEGLLEVGLALIGASGITLGGGVAAPPGEVVVSPADVASAESVRANRPVGNGPESGQINATLIGVMALVAIAIILGIALL